MVKCSRKSIALSNLWVSSNDKLSDFYASSWQRESPVPLLVIRVVTMVLAVAILAWSVHEARSVYWLLYLTNWGLLLLSSMLVSAVIVSFMALIKKVPDAGELPWYISMYWLLYNISICISFTITLLYWILLYNPELYNDESRKVFWLDVASHGITSCLALAEVLASRTPVRFLHVYQPLGVGLWYAAFTAIYYALGGTDLNGYPFLYEVLDWRQGKRSTIMVVASAVGLVVIYSALWVVALFRDWVSGATFRTTTMHLPPVPPNPKNPLPLGFA